MRLSAGLLLLALTVPLSAQAQQAPIPPYKPGLGDMMTMLVQPRHTKLGLAGQAQNWPYAEYELLELQESFEKAARFSPKWRTFAIAEMMEAVTKAPLTALTEAINTADATKFAQAYKDLTDACNACHTSAGLRVIVIQVPTGTPFPNQNFQPTGR